MRLCAQNADILCFARRLLPYVTQELATQHELRVVTSGHCSVRLQRSAPHQERS